jgi:hypothetical protein
MKRFKLFILALFFLSACKDDKLPKGIIEEEKMIDIITELHVIDGYMSVLPYNDSIKIKAKNFYSSVYKNNGVTKYTYEKSLKYYSMDPIKLDSMYSQVLNKLDKKEKLLNKEDSKSSEIK